jgi:hypothetical protein
MPNASNAMQVFIFVPNAKLTDDEEHAKGVRFGTCG